MKNFRYLILCILVLIACSVARATELDGLVYKQWGKYSVLQAENLRIYYPNSIESAMPRILTTFSEVRKNVLANFPYENNYVATVILDDHDDIVSSSVDANQDLIHLSIADEIDMLSARSYTLEKRFAYAFAKTIIKRSTSNISFSWRRKLALLMTPTWYIEGMAFNYAFPMDSLQYSRVLDLARNNRLYTIDELNSIDGQGLVKKEEMMFQAHSMMEYWGKTYNKDADLKLIRASVREPRSFDRAFKNFYGVSLKEAYKSYVDYMKSLITKEGETTKSDFIHLDDLTEKNKFFRYYSKISDDESIWVSSKRYTTENYDLYYKKGNNRPVILLKNVHPYFIYNETHKKIVIGKFYVNTRKEKRLGLFTVDTHGNSKRLTSESGSFLPLDIKDDKVYYVNNHGGVIKVMAKNLNDSNSEEAEEILNLGSLIRPSDMDIDLDHNRVILCCMATDSKSHIVEIPLNSKDVNNDIKPLFTHNGDLVSIYYDKGKIWCSAMGDYSTAQLYCFDEEKKEYKKITRLVGGVWDFDLSELEKNKVFVTTLNNGVYSIASVNLNEEELEKVEFENTFPKDSFVLKEIKPLGYKTEFLTSRWKPRYGKDAGGRVIGIYSTRSETLDRSGYTLAPTYGIKSHEFGYSASFMKRFDLIKATLSFNDATTKKTYMENEYFEKNRSKRLQFEYPLRLDLKLLAGIDLVDRKITKVEKDVNGRFPSEGKDNSYFLSLVQKSIRTEPNNEIFPRKGRKVELTYKYGSKNLFNGGMSYDNISLKWDEFIPLNKKYVLTLSGWVAQDNKRNGIRRPEDLSLGGKTYLRAYKGSSWAGDKLRYVSLSLGRPVRFDLPKSMPWIKNEFSALSVFWEMGDTQIHENFDYHYDRGIEWSSRLLFLQRIPVSFKAGYALRNGSHGHGSYVAFYLDDIKAITSK